MNRRNFLRTLVGGVAASAAVRTWPFRTYFFPKEIVVPELSLAGLPYWEDGKHVGDFMGIQRVEVKQTVIHLGKEGIWQVDSIGETIISQHRLEMWPFYQKKPCDYVSRVKEISIEEAKCLFPLYDQSQVGVVAHRSPASLPGVTGIT